MYHYLVSFVVFLCLSCCLLCAPLFISLMLALNYTNEVATHAGGSENGASAVKQELPDGRVMGVSVQGKVSRLRVQDLSIGL